MARAHGSAAGNARQPFRWGGQRCRQCQAATLRGAAALVVSPERVVAGALGGPPQWGLDRVPYGSANAVLQAVAGSPHSAEWLQVGPFCAGSLLV